MTTSTFFLGQHSGWQINTPASQCKCCGFKSELRPFGVEIACPSCARVGFIQVLCFPLTFQKHDRSFD